MKKEKIQKGWVVVFMDGKRIFDYSFQRTRSDSIKKYMKLWDPAMVKWSKLKKRGYKCVKAKLTIEIL